MRMACRESGHTRRREGWWGAILFRLGGEMGGLWVDDDVHGLRRSRLLDPRPLPGRWSIYVLDRWLSPPANLRQASGSVGERVGGGLGSGCSALDNGGRRGRVWVVWNDLWQHSEYSLLVRASLG